MKLINSDIPELEGSNCEIVLDNLKELENRFEKLITERIAHIYELSQAVIDDGGETDVIKSIILSFKTDSDDSSIDNSKEIECTGLSSIYSSLSLLERLVLINRIVSLPEYNKDYSLLTHVTAARHATDKIAYLKNSYADSAYFQFSSILSSPKTAYYEGTDDVCESVINGECEFCILPVENSGNGKLMSFYEKILRYELKIISVCDVKHSDNNGYTKFALLSRNLQAINQNIKTKSKNRYFEFAFNCDEYPTLSDILTAAEFCSLKVSRIDTLNPGKTPLINPTLRIDNADINTFIAFLSIDCPDFIPIGIYTHI